jgi:undecaprenyl-diphosphatase
MFEWLEKIDRQLFLFLNGLHVEWLDTVMWYISTIGIWFIPFIIFLLFAYKKGGWRFVAIIILGTAICILLSDRISVDLFKNVFERYRPTHNLEIRDLVHIVQDPNGEYYRGGKFSFVSSHASTATAIGVFILLHFRKYGNSWYFILPFVALISYSRIYLGVHYPGDIIGGTLLGATIAFIVYIISKQFLVSKAATS